MAVPRAIWSVVPSRIIRRHWVFPLAIEGRLPHARLRVAMLDPTDLALADDISFATNLAVMPVRMAPEELRQLITAHLGEEPDPSRLPPVQPHGPEGIELPEATGELELEEPGTVAATIPRMT
jgi:hypothetical protein